MHELEALRPLLESALVQVQMSAEPRNFALRLVSVPAKGPDLPTNIPGHAPSQPPPHSRASLCLQLFRANGSWQRRSRSARSVPRYNFCLRTNQYCHYCI